MNDLKTFAVNHISKEVAIYGTLVIAGTVFFLKRIFGRKKINKNFFDKNKKKVCTRSKLFFRDLLNKIEVKPKSIQKKEEENLTKKDKYFKMKQFVQKVADNFEKTKILEKNDKEEKHFNISQDSGDKKDQIFYFLLNNVTHMITHANIGK